MATTTNFGWETPDDTDLVKDGAAAIRTLGNSIDTSFLDFKGGTTGQILSKASNTDLDYAWITNDVGDITAVTAGTGISGGGSSGAVTITNSMATAIDAKGDLIVGTGADTFDRLAVGTNGQALLADSTTATGLKWGSASAAKSYALINTGGTALTGAQTVTYSGLSGYDSYLIIIETASSASAQAYIGLRFNSDTTNGNYANYGQAIQAPSTYSANQFTYVASTGSYFALGTLANNANSTLSASIMIEGANSSGAYKPILSVGGTANGSGSAGWSYNTGGWWKNTSTISSISVFSDTGNLDSPGIMYIYGSA